MSEKEKQQLIDDILKRDKFTGASVPIYQHIQQLEPYLHDRGLKGVRNCAERIKSYKLKPKEVLNKTVIDFGCDNGMMMYEFYKRGAIKTVGIQHPKVGDEAERIARLVGNKGAIFHGIDLTTATAETMRSSTGVHQFDVVLYLAMDSYFGHLPVYLFELTKELLIYEKLIDNVSPEAVMKGLTEMGFKKVDLVGRVYDSPLQGENGNYVIKAYK